MTPTARIDLPRFLRTLDTSSSIGRGRENGLSRLALTDADREMRDVFVGWCREAGLRVTVDAMGSIFARREGLEPDLPPVLMGSHLDTQVNGGRFDGIVGVLGALEVMRTLDDLGIRTRRPLEVVCWTNEEGSRFTPPMVASGCFVGAYDVQWAHQRPSDDGPTLGQELQRIGYLGETPVGGRAVDAYLELHIEQGDELDRAGKQVGVVTHGYRSHGALVEFRGETAHTGPWPMSRRRNALVAAARLLVAVDDIGWEFAATGGKGTAARLVAWPNKAGTLSDWAEAVCDVRHADPQIAAFMNEKLLRAVDEIAARCGCEARVLDRWDWGGDIFAADMVEQVRRSIAGLGYSTMDLPSQAGHDAYFMATRYPTAMIFTPCRGGITHNNQELATPEDLEPGLNVLLQAALERADRP